MSRLFVKIVIGQHLECFPLCFVPPEKFPIECSLGRHCECFLGNTFSAPLGGARVLPLEAPENLECFLGKHLELSPLALLPPEKFFPWEVPRVLPWDPWEEPRGLPWEALD